MTGRIYNYPFTVTNYQFEMTKGDDIQARLVGFAVAVIRLCDALPATGAGRHIAGQLLRSGTSPAPNYGEARGAESRNDFIHKLKIVHKELNESGVWLRIIRESGLMHAGDLVSLEAECDALCRIVSTSVKTTVANGKRKRIDNG